MKNRWIMASLVAASLIVSCQDNDVQKATEENEVTPQIIEQIKSLGFGTRNVKATAQGYVVEGDVLLTKEFLADANTSEKLAIAEEEHYRTTNKASGKTYKVYLSSLLSGTTKWNEGFKLALKRYNDLGLTIKFEVATNRTGANITVNKDNTIDGYGLSGFPSSSGVPYKTVYVNTDESTGDKYFIASLIAHEIGHCIGMRHTDYMNRNYSCDWSKYRNGEVNDEGQDDVGAVHISGTPTGVDTNSWMLACTDTSTDRPFTANDKIALDYLW